MNNAWLIMALMDKKVGRYEKPFPVSHVTEATRALQQALKQGTTNVALYPEDYALYLVAEFNSVSGEVLSATPQHILEVVSLVNPNLAVQNAQA